MSKSKTTESTAATDPATTKHLQILARQRKNANRALLKRRRKKSGQ